MTPIEEDLTKTLTGNIVCENDIATACYNLPTDFEGFSGHFPGHPILPAILQFMIGRLVCSELASAPLKVRSIGRAKFSHEIAPQTDIHVQAVRKAVTEAGEQRFALTLTVDGAKASTFSMTCIADVSHA